MMNLLFETKRLIVRKLVIDDLTPFHEMQGNINVMRFVRGKAMTFDEDKKDLQELIEFYDKKDNDFWIYAVERKIENKFVGTIAFVKDSNNDDEIGYRFLEKYWGNGYGTEIVEGMIEYCKKNGFKKLVACVANDNIASDKIIKKAGFQFVESFVSDDLKIPEQKYILNL
ncbi:GNAT family N-acetyltransferase [Urechidicola croceus]|uniref:N-acetyltransferase domain-containing protein n=1 Tax=Urechidicola croceus TaxID=1850246 RepID=A0A1D8P5Z2_9FLAO|nr:GNAT family N-acetyltransferase [Urechidicola croceus]AOW19986.1 hypothetical protein LPB138_04485 [Urechidicola croceus]